MKLRLILSTVAVIASTTTLFGQGFINLNFESATVPPTPPGAGGGPVNPAMAFPGWTVGFGGPGSPNFTLYNALTLGSVAQVLIGPNYPLGSGYAPLQGSYSALLQFGPSPTLGTPALIQTGLVPADALSISFLVSPTRNDARVLLNGTEISLFSIGGGRMAGDVSAFSGSQAQLTFTTRSYDGNWLYFDDVAFSTLPVPEPSSYLLGGLGALVWLAFRRRPNQAMQRTAPRPDA
jgi:hypothetical protein